MRILGVKIGSKRVGSGQSRVEKCSAHCSYYVHNVSLGSPIEVIFMSTER